MKIQNYEFNKSSFLSVEKDFSLIVDKILKNDRLKKLLYYNSVDALRKPNLTEEQSISLLGKQIKNVPKVYIDSDVLTYIVISFDNFIPNPLNPEFRNNTIIFDIMCHFDQWQLEDFKLRPYRIAAEIDQMLDKKHLTGIGNVHFAGAFQSLKSDEFIGIEIIYNVIHGEEDKTHPLNPQDEELLYGVD